MDQETQKMIKESLRLSRESNEMVRKMYIAQRRERFWRFMKTLLIIALLFGAYYMVAPLINNLTDAYTGVLESFNKIQGARNSLTF